MATPSPPSNWGAWVAQQLTTRAWRYADLARRTDIPPSAISQWISRKQQPTPESLRKVARVFNIKLIDLYVIAGLLTAEEAAQPPSSPAADLTTVSTLDLLAELSNRTIKCEAEKGRVRILSGDNVPPVTFHVAATPEEARRAIVEERLEPNESTGRS